MSAARYNVGICGSYGGMNLGDESILAVVVRELRRRASVSLTVLSRDPVHTMAHHRLERAVAVRECSRARLSEEMRDLDLLILGGGGILFDGEASEFVRPVLLAHELGIPVATWAIGVGPLESRTDQLNVLRALEGAVLITVRDRPSQMLLEHLGVTRNIVVTGDPAHLLEPEPFTDRMLADEAVVPGPPIVGVSVRGAGPAAPGIDRKAHQLIAAAVDYLIERLEAMALFIPMERGDLRDSHLIASLLANPSRARFLTGSYSANQVRGLVEQLAFGVGTRLHFLLFTASAAVPSVTLSSGPKVGALADQLGLPSLPLRLTEPGQLIATIDRAWHQREELGVHLRERSRVLAERAARTAGQVAELLTVGPHPGERP